MKFTEAGIAKLYQDQYRVAREELARLPVAQGREPNIRGLSGWVYEQTIRSSLAQELGPHSQVLGIEEQVPLHGHVRLDLVIGKAAVELKAAGSFGADEKYIGFRAAVEGRGWHYLYLSLAEGHEPYRSEIRRIFGGENTFYLDVPGDWVRFVRRVLEVNGPPLN